MIERKAAVKSPQVAGTVPHNPAPINSTLGHTEKTALFHKENYLLMLGGLLIIAFGMLLMSGGKSTDPNVFDQKEVYSTTRITIAPILIVLGLAFEVFAIFKKPKAVS